MQSTYTTRDTAADVVQVSAWKSPRFQRFAAITIGTSLLLSAVAIMCLSGDVDVVTKQQIPYIQSQLANLPAR